MKFYWFILLCFLSILSVFSQEEGELLHAKRHKYDPIYRVNYFDKMIIKVDINSDVDNFHVPNFNLTSNAESIFIPNQKSKIRLSFDYKFLGLFVSMSTNFNSKESSAYGDTKILDLSFKYFYSDRLRQEVEFKNIKGFYLENPDGFSPVEVYPNLEIKTIGGKTFYILDNDFSYRAYDNLTERQIKNAGSFIPSIGYYFNRLKSKRTSDTEKYLTQVKSFDAIIQYGYMYNMVLGKKWFTTIGAHPGIGINNSKSYFYEDKLKQESIIKSTHLNLNLDLNFALGYNNKNTFAGFKMNFRDYQYESSKTAELINSKLYFDIFVGYRFNEVKKIKKVFELLEKKVF